MGRRQVKGGPTSRGYGIRHQEERAYRLRRFRPGDPCARCGLPMYGPATELHLDHTDDRTGYLPGLSHARCNTGHGRRRRKQVLPPADPVPPSGYDDLPPYDCTEHGFDRCEFRDEPHHPSGRCW
jgi:hypothetical protein